MSLSTAKPVAGTTTNPTTRPGSTTVPSVSYEVFAPRSTSQVARLNRLAALTAGPTARALHDNQRSGDDIDIKNGRSHALTAALTPPKSVSSGVLGFGDEETKQEDPVVNATLKESAVAVDYLRNQLKYTTSLRLAVRASINIAEDISNRHAELIRHSGELSAAADRLQEEERMLSRHAQEIGMPLQHYDAVDRIGVVVGVLFKGKTTVHGLSKVKVDSDDFPSVLDDIDKAVVFFGNECGGKEALQAELKKRSANTKQEQSELTSGNVEYYRRALALQEAALNLIKEAVADRITTTTQQIAGALNVSKGNAILADQLEASLIYTRFHGISSRSNRLLTLVRTRVPNSSSPAFDSGVGDAYLEILQQCRHAYCTSREFLLRTTVRAHMDKLKDQHGPVGMTRLASVFLIRLCTIETSLYLDFFGEKKVELSGDSEKKSAVKASASSGNSQHDDTAFKDSEFQSYLTSLCSSLHRTVRRALVTMLDLDSLCQIVSVLREERSLSSSSPTTMAAARAISSVIQDAQERIIFCANSTLTKEVIKFKATPDDLNYPDKLRKQKDADGAAPDASTVADDDAVEQQLQRVYESWFPPMRTVLKILSKIFRVVESRVFEDMALQSVRSCTKCLKEGAEYINSHKGEIHSDLFLVKHFLVLREQLSPFDIELRSVERQLDFSDAGKAVARFLANRNRRVFSMSTENALVTLLREGVSVQEASVDSKRDLEDALRSACNDFIEHTARAVAADVLDIVESTKAMENASKADSILKVLNATADKLEVSLGEVTSQMSLYLDNASTQNILLKPVSRKITRALEDIRKCAGKTESGVNGWDDGKKRQVTELTFLIEQAVKTATRMGK